MIITRTPLRISLGGGGTDLPDYYREAGRGFLIAAAITKYVYIAAHRNFDDDVLLKYSAVERVPTSAEAMHPLLRASLKLTGIDRGIEITSMADIPTGTGLGSSGSFTVGVLRALRAFQHETVSNIELAEQACHIEIDMLGEPVGKQDQYIAAVGGITAFEFHANERVDVMPLDLTMATRNRLDDNLVLFFTGIRRSASEVLAEQQSANRPDTKISLRENLDQVRAIGYETRDALAASDLARFGALLTGQWQLKYERAPGPVHDEIDGWIRRGIDAGALGGKLVGAGGGGFLLFYAEDKALLRDEMSALGLEEIRFGIDYEGRVDDCQRSVTDRTVVVLAGGLGTRMAALTGGTLPKALLPIAGRPFVDHKLAEIERLGGTRVVFLLGHGGDQLTSHVQSVPTAMTVELILDGPVLLGTGGAVKRAVMRGALAGDVWITYGDTLLDVDLAAAEQATNRAAIMTVLRNEDRFEPSNVSVREGLVVAYAKGDPPGTHAYIDYGYLRLPTAALTAVEDDSFDLEVVIDVLVQKGELAAFEATERFHDIGTPKALAETEKWLTR